MAECIRFLENKDIIEYKHLSIYAIIIGKALKVLKALTFTWNGKIQCSFSRISRN
jgi:hypothetical protein